jgi:hypothetical protein
MDTFVYARPTPQPRQMPPNRRAPFRPPRVSRFHRLLPSLRSAWQTPHAWRRSTTGPPQWLPVGFRHPLTGYLLALLIDLVAASLTLLLVLLFPAFDLHELLLLLGIVLVALTCGVGPGVLATCVGLLLLEAIALPPHFSWRLPSPADWVDLVVLFVSGISLSLLVGALRTAKASSDEERQRLRTQLEVVDHRLPWQGPLPAEKLTPARVRRALSHLLPMLSSDGVCTKSLWALAWAPQRTEIDPSTTISCDQIDHMISAKPKVARLLPTSCLHVGSLLLVKWQAHSTSDNIAGTNHPARHESPENASAPEELPEALPQLQDVPPRLITRAAACLAVSHQLLWHWSAGTWQCPACGS